MPDRKSLTGRTSAWNLDEIERYLSTTTVPMRLACNTARGYPLLNSLWYEYRDGFLCCAMHEDAAVIRHLERDPRCAFEVAPNDPPYCGVRGQGHAELLREGAAETLERLIARYLGDSSPRLAAWLLGRAQEEYLVRIRPEWLTAWDYRSRMQAT